MKDKYSWSDNDENGTFTVVHMEGSSDGRTIDVTVICITDTAEKADFISKACNSYKIPD